MRRQQIALTAFILSPIVVLIALCWTIAVSMKEPRKMNVPPVGAGAGNTGGANAIGELIAHGTTKPSHAEPQPPAAAAMVEPESLAQGFYLIVEDKSGKANPSSPIYLASNYNNWNPGDAGAKLEPQSDMKWRILVKRPAGRTDRMEYKFTRGSWVLEELKPDMSAPGNRTLPLVDASAIKNDEPPKIEQTVYHWGDEKPENAVKAALDSYREIKVAGNLKRLQVDGGAGSAPGTTRELLVWLPPGYEDPRNAAVKYPVLYLHDGQNVFEKLPTVPGEWQADETASRLISAHQMSPVIIVGVPHSGVGRISEYMPVDALDGVTPQGDRHVNWLLNEVMPRVARTFRVKSGPENTGIGGSSLGAVISLYAAVQHPEVFGLVLAESLPLRTGKAAAWDMWLAGVKQWPRKVYMGIGGAETGESGKNLDRNRAYVEAVQALDSTLDKAGLGPDRRLLIVEPKATHTEDAWAKRLPGALTFLFPPPMDGTK